ncbi:MAG: DNA polymerase ligase N-terminal domain-containing protein [Methanomassiliicoccus sp.]|nr:DNA polymerase ligase N-terminal domain-containing protein [Methanomassiliicoccus sp.]
MKERLQEYKEKRDFTRTPEPVGEEEYMAPFFVVQDHHASSHHHDFRLLMDGTLKSWAVPKLMPEEPKVKRLAVQTEDHPVAYGGFEGTIPAGEYGAGEVRLFDRGPYELLERTSSKIVVKLDGQKLNGTYALIKFKGKEGSKKNWLVMRMR